MKCEVGKGDGVRDQHSALSSSHGVPMGRALAVQCWHRCSRVWGGPAAARLSRLHERSHTVPGDAADRVQFSAFGPIILRLLSSSVLAQGDDGASSTSASLLDQVDGQEFRIVSIYLFIRIWQHSAVRREGGGK